MRLLCCGDRNWDDINTITNWMRAFFSQHDVNTIIHGNARGADRLSALVAQSLGIKNIESYPAKWGIYGKGAGPIRNQQMIDEGKPDFIVAFHNDIRNSKGTKDMITRAQNNAIEYTVIKSELS